MKVLLMVLNYFRNNNLDVLEHDTFTLRHQHHLLIAKMLMSRIRTNNKNTNKVFRTFENIQTSKSQRTAKVFDLICLEITKPGFSYSQ